MLTSEQAYYYMWWSCKALTHSHAERYSCIINTDTIWSVHDLPILVTDCRLCLAVITFSSKGQSCCITFTLAFVSVSCSRWRVECAWSLYSFTAMKLAVSTIHLCSSERKQAPHVWQHTCGEQYQWTFSVRL